MRTRTESETVSVGSVNGLDLTNRRYFRSVSLRRRLRRRIIDWMQAQLGRKPTCAQPLNGTGATTEVVGLGNSSMLNFQAIKRAVEQLPLGYRVVFGLHDVYGYRHEEIAFKLGISVSTSKSHLHDARLRLRALLFQR